MSSTIATVSRNSRSWSGQRGPSRASAPSTNAMSVAIAIPQPRAPSPPALTSRKISAGRIIPPSAASTGTRTVRRSRSSPTVTSRVTSRPTTRKNSAISPSSTQCRRSMVSSAEPTRIPASVAHSRSYASAQGEFAHSKASTVAATSSRLEPISVARNSRNASVNAGRANRLAGPGGGIAAVPDTGPPRSRQQNADQASRHTTASLTGRRALRRRRPSWPPSAVRAKPRSGVEDRKVELCAAGAPLRDASPEDGRLASVDAEVVETDDDLQGCASQRHVRAFAAPQVATSRQGVLAGQQNPPARRRVSGRWHGPNVRICRESSDPAGSSCG